MSLERGLGLRADETLLMIVRRAPITLLVPLGFAALCILAPLVFAVPLLRLETLGKAVIGLSETIGWLLGMRVLIVRQASFLAVTDRRAILVRRRGTFDRHVTELPYSHIQRVSYRIRGLWATLFRYGSLIIESAGNEEPLAIERISRPARVQDLLNQLQRGTPGGFGDLLQSVSRLDARQLGLLKSEVDRTLRLLFPDERA